ncbi:hypothetical protein [Desulfopila inferna]|uniref:hypothetical protein n=1 Tax=Desulfopila inferna TaxID=468528 RepID=UPI001965CF0B|nr:hypothetical protein [Desulfopila inferna]MBM9603796.1 hypothetical protein [Desulfopila inferna]
MRQQFDKRQFVKEPVLSGAHIFQYGWTPDKLGLRENLIYIVDTANFVSDTASGISNISTIPATSMIFDLIINMSKKQ